MKKLLRDVNELLRIDDIEFCKFDVDWMRVTDEREMSA